MDAAFWQRLLAADIPAERCRTLLSRLGNARFTCDQLDGLATYLTPTERENLRRADMAAFQKVIDAGARVVPFTEFPDTLDQAQGTPPAVFLWGREEALEPPKVAIVGTRGCSTYGRAAAQKFAEGLALSGVTVVSGGAAGIDAAAHEGALSAGGNTVAVLGTGIEQVYPAMHRHLFERIKEQGCLVSQFAAGAKPKPYRFPMRNFLIAAVSDAVLIVEAPERSGALITAHAAAEMGRLVFVVPSNITNPGFRGSHALIRDGATLVDHPDQVLEGLDLPVSGPPATVEEAAGTQKLIVDALAVRPLSAELLVDQTGLTTAEVLSELTMLELEGRVLRSGEGYSLKG